MAPTASISIICGGTSACVEPIPANVYTHKTLSGAFSVRNPYLQELLASKGQDTPETWASIVEQEGSVQHLTCLDDDEKSVYRTAFELLGTPVRVVFRGEENPFAGKRNALTPRQFRKRKRLIQRNKR